MITDLSAETMQANRQWKKKIYEWKGKNNKGETDLN